MAATPSGSVTRSSRLQRAAAVAALLTAAALLLGAVGPAAGMRWAADWLALLFGINAGLGHLSLRSLHALAPLDIVVLALATLAFAGFWPGPGRPHKVWTGLAVALPLAGIAVLLATGYAGRSGLMGGGLVLSALMLSEPATRRLSILGLSANALLLIGDFVTTDARMPLVAVVVGGGYALLIGWFLMCAWTLSSTGRKSRSGSAIRA